MKLLCITDDVNQTMEQETFNVTNKNISVSIHL